jgi:hypothetical protein
MTIDNVLSFETVIADGKVLTASAGENGDPFWAGCLLPGRCSIVLFAPRRLRGVFNPSIIHFTGKKEPIKLALSS